MTTSESSPDRYDPAEFTKAKREYEQMHRPPRRSISSTIDEGRKQCAQAIKEQDGHSDQ